MRTFQIPITLSDEEIKTLKKFKSGASKDWDILGESYDDYRNLHKLLDLTLIYLYSRTKQVTLTDFGKQILEQLNE